MIRVSDPHRLEEALGRALGQLGLGRYALEWASLIPFDELATSHPRCSMCQLWRGSSDERMGTVWGHSRWLWGDAYERISAGLRKFTPHPPSDSSLVRHFVGGSDGPGHLGFRLAMQRQEAERHKARLIEQAGEAAARVPVSYQQIAEQLEGQLETAVAFEHVAIGKMHDVKLGFEIAQILRARDSKAISAYSALAFMGQLEEATREVVGQEAFAAIMQRVEAKRARGRPAGMSSTLASPAPDRRSFAGDLDPEEPASARTDEESYDEPLAAVE